MQKEVSVCKQVLAEKAEEYESVCEDLRMCKQAVAERGQDEAALFVLRSAQDSLKQVLAKKQAENEAMKKVINDLLAKKAGVTLAVT